MPDPTPTDDPLSTDLAFTPAAPHRRHDGWSAERQRTFIRALAETGCVSDACKAVQISPRSAYRLRQREDGVAFARAWDQALIAGVNRLTALAVERAVHGTPREVWYKGERVGTERRASDRLLMFLLSHHDKMRYGRLSGLLPIALADPRIEAEAALGEALDSLADSDAPADGLRTDWYEATGEEHVREL